MRESSVSSPMKLLKNRLNQTLELCSGYTTVADEELEKEYKKKYHFIIKKDENNVSKTFFPVFYVVVRQYEDWVEKTMLYVPRNKYLFKDEKTGRITY